MTTKHNQRILEQIVRQDPEASAVLTLTVTDNRPVQAIMFAIGHYDAASQLKAIGRLRSQLIDATAAYVNVLDREIEHLKGQS